MLAVITPFEGKAWALDRWLDSLKAADLPADTQLVWLCNSPDDSFYQRLEAASHEMPWKVTLWRDATKARGETAERVKWDTVAYLWRELRKRIPAEVERVLCLEDDVLVSSSAVGVLLAQSVEHGTLTVTVGPTSSRLPGESDSGYGVWVRTVFGHQLAPRNNPTVRIDCCSFGCTMFPRALFDLLPLTSDWERGLGYDSKAGPDTYRLGGRMVALWGARCVHMEHPPLQSKAAVAPVYIHESASPNAEYYRQREQDRKRKRPRPAKPKNALEIWEEMQRASGKEAH